jgi:hypothetical protein
MGGVQEIIKKYLSTRRPLIISPYIFLHITTYMICLYNMMSLFLYLSLKTLLFTFFTRVLISIWSDDAKIKNIIFLFFIL